MRKNREGFCLFPKVREFFFHKSGIFFSTVSVFFPKLSDFFPKVREFFQKSGNFSQSQGFFPKSQWFFPKKPEIFSPKSGIFFPDANNVLKRNIMKTDFFPFNNEFFYWMKGKIPVWSSENSGKNLRTANRKHQIDRPYGP